MTVAPAIPTPPPSSLTETVTALQRRFGPAALRRGGDVVSSTAWATGMPAIDGLVAAGGLPCGRLSVLLAGNRGVSGRLTLLQALAAVASRSMQVAYVDLVGTLDPGFLADLGADLDACLVVRPDQLAPGPGLAMARALVRAGVPWLGIAMAPIRRSSTAAMEHAVSALAGAVEGSRAIACVSAPAPLAAPLAYASSLTVECASLGWQEAHGDVVGLRVGMRTLKSKVGAPSGEASLLLRYPRPQAMGEVVGFPAVVGHAGGDLAGLVAPAVAVAG
jgi:hypothetical protein